MTEPTFREKYEWWAETAVDNETGESPPHPDVIERQYAEAHPADPVEACARDARKELGLAETETITLSAIIRKHLGPLLVSPALKGAAIEHCRFVRKGRAQGVFASIHMETENLVRVTEQQWPSEVQGAG